MVFFLALELYGDRPVKETATTHPENNLTPEESSPVEPMTRAGESLREASAQTTLLTAKSKTRIGTWNIRTLYKAGKFAQVSGEMHRYNLKMLGLCETRWNGTGQTRLMSGDTIIYSGHEEGHPHVHGVALLLTPETAQALLSWEPVSPRLLPARFNSKGRKVTVIQCYAPTNEAETEEKEAFYEQLQEVIYKVRRRDLKILIGDLNAKVGADNTNRELVPCLWHALVLASVPFGTGASLQACLSSVSFGTPVIYQGFHLASQ